MWYILGMAERERKSILENPYALGYLRHYASAMLAAGRIKNTYGVLWPDERKMCREEGMVLPAPYLGYWNFPKRRDPDQWLCRIGATVDGDPAFGVWQREGTWDVS